MMLTSFLKMLKICEVGLQEMVLAAKLGDPSLLSRTHVSEGETQLSCDFHMYACMYVHVYTHTYHHAPVLARTDITGLRFQLLSNAKFKLLPPPLWWCQRLNQEPTLPREMPY